MDKVKRKPIEVDLRTVKLAGEDLSFACPRCNKVWSVKLGQRGKTATCRCGCIFTIPRAMPPQPPETPPPKKQKPKPQPPAAPVRPVAITSVDLDNRQIFELCVRFAFWFAVASVVIAVVVGCFVMSWLAAWYALTWYVPKLAATVVMSVVPLLVVLGWLCWWAAKR